MIPDAKSKICFDKFHVVEDLNEAIDVTRKSEMKWLDPVWRKALHTSRYTWLRNQNNLKRKHPVNYAAMFIMPNDISALLTIDA